MKTTKSAAKGSSKGFTATSKVLASKAKIVSAKQIARTVKAGKVPLKETLKVKQKATLGVKSTALKNQPDAGNKEHVMVAKETDEDDKSTNKTIEGGEEIVTGGKVPPPEAETDSTAPVQLGGAGDEAEEPMEVGSSAEALAENPADRPSKSQPSTSSGETAPTETSQDVLAHDQKHTLSEPRESTAAAPESRTDAPQVAAVGEVGTKASQKGKLKIRWTVCVEIKKNIFHLTQNQSLEDPQTAIETQKKASSSKVLAVTRKPAATAVSKQLPAVSTPYVKTPYECIGERIGQKLKTTGIGKQSERQSLFIANVFQSQCKALHPRSSQLTFSLLLFHSLHNPEKLQLPTSRFLHINIMKHFCICTCSIPKKIFFLCPQVTC